MLGLPSLAIGLHKTLGFGFQLVFQTGRSTNNKFYGGEDPTFSNLSEKEKKIDFESNKKNHICIFYETIKVIMLVHVIHVT